MSSDGNNSKNIAPFTMFSSSAEGGYLTELHTNFTGGIEINNLHTDTYGEFRHPPAQGTFTNKFVGGNTHRHHSVGQADRVEAFSISFESPQSFLFESTTTEVTPIAGAPAGTDLMFELDGGGNIQPLDPPADNDSIWELDGDGNITTGLPNGAGTLIITRPTRPVLYRDEYAKRSVNIKNIRQQSPGNFAQTRDVIHTSGRTLNPGQARAAAYSVTYPLFPRSENPVLNVSGTNSLEDYPMPELSSSASAHVFVNRFSSPGDRYTMSRGFLNPIGEEYSAYNVMPFRNLNVREENNENLTTHNEQFAAENHSTNRNTRYQHQPSPQDSTYNILIDGDTPSGIAVDSEAGEMYWTTITAPTRKVKKAKLDGTSVETLSTHPGATLGGIALDTAAQEMYWVVNNPTSEIRKANLDGSSETILVGPASGLSAPTSLALDLVNGKIYWTDYGTQKIQRSNLDGSSVEDIVTGTPFPWSIATNSSENKVYWSDNGKIRRADMSPASPAEDVISGLVGTPYGLSFDFENQKMYWILTTGVYNSDISIGATQTELISGLTDPFYLSLDPENGQMYWTDYTTEEINRANMPGIPHRAYDNANINHAIPQNTLQYSWINDSAEDTVLDFQGFATGSDITFYSDTIGFDSPMNSVHLDEDNNTQDFDFTGSVYGYNTWKQIRGGNLKLSRHYRENSILAAANNKDIITQFSEPAVVAKHKPMEHVIGIDSTDENYTVKSPYGNELVRHSNEEINELFAYIRSDEGTSYTQLKDNYINRSIDDPANPVKRFVSMTYGETVFPRSENAFTKKVKLRGNYTEITGTGSNGYDRLYGTQNTFYHSTNKRTAGATNSQGATPNSFSEESYIEAFSKGEDWSNHAHRWLKDETSQVLRDPVSGSHAFVMGGAKDEFVEARYLMYHQPFIGNFTASFDLVSGLYSPLSMSSQPSLGVEALFIQKRSATSDWQSFGTLILGGASPYDATWGTASFSASLAEPHQIRFANLAISYPSYDSNQVALRDISFTGTPASPDEQLAFSPMKTSGTGSFRLSASYDENVGELNFDTDTSLYRKGTIPSLNFTEENAVIYNNTSSHYTERLIEEMSSKYPAYDKHEDYSDNLHPQAKETSIVPEFRVSENMPFYIGESGGNFREKNKKFLSLLGSEHSSSAASHSANSFDTSFEAVHLTTDTVEHFEKMKKDHIGHSKPRNLKLTAKGIKKLLPYNGFYPDTRTIQLGNLLSSSFSDSIQSYRFDSSISGTLSAEKEKGWAGFLKPIQSPGILYNTIKAGVGVGYPIYSQTVTASADYQNNSLGDNHLTRAPDYRLPFETLVNFNQNMPKDSNVFHVSEGSKEESSEQTFPYYFRWNGQSLPYYELATHNFLAESVNFFLDKGQVNSFVSSPEKEFLQVEADKNYYMDVVLRDSNDSNKFVNFKGTKKKYPNFEQTSDETVFNYGNANGWDVAITSDGAGGYYSAVASPPVATGNTGHIRLLHVDAAGNKEDLDPDRTLLTGSNALDFYGASVAITSGSTGVYTVVGATGNDTVYLYEYAGGTLSLVDEYDGSDPGAVDNFGLKTAIHSSSYGIAIATLSDNIDPGPPTDMRDRINVNLLRLFGGNLILVDKLESEHMDDFASVESDFHEYGIDMVSGSSSGHVIAVSSQRYQDGGNYGAVGIYNQVGATLVENGVLLNPVNPTDQGFGSDVSIAQDPLNPEQAIVVVGSGLGQDQFTAGWEGDRVDVFYGALNNLELSAHIGSVTSSGDYGMLSNFKSFGTKVKCVIAGPIQPLSGTDGIYNAYLAISNPLQLRQAGLGSSVGGTIELKKLSYTSAGALSFPHSRDYSIQDFTPSFDADTFTGPHFGHSMDMTVDITGDDLFIAAGSPFYSGSLSAGGIAHVIYGSSSYHDYRQDGKLFGMPIENTYDPAYCAYTHPGFYGESVARIAFSSSVGGAITLEEIFREARVTEILNIDDNRVRTITGSAAPLTALQDDAKMPVGSSVTLFGKSIQPSLEFALSENGEQSRIDKVSSGAKNNVRWAISTKYECPVLDVSSSDYAANYTTDIVAPSQIFELESGSVDYDLPRSVWTSYGTATPPSKKYSFELRESFSRETIDSGIAGSLIELCGFTPDKKNIGSVAEQKVISEALMVVPYVDTPIKNKTLEVEDGKHFFRINNAELRRQKRSLEDNGFAVSEDIRETSITQTITAMKDYVVPPHYDFLKYKDIKPFVAYFLEFEHTLSQRDLMDIWQGVSPSIALNPETDEVEISHDFDKHNFFHGIDLPSDIKFMVFKVKKKAEWNYYDITTDSTDDSRFKFDLKGDGKKEVVPEYNYNWPYDFFSLVERAKVDVDITFKKDDEE